MPTWTHNDIRKHMHVYSLNHEDLGHVAEVYEDSFLIYKGLLFHKDRYIPYNAISTVDKDHIELAMSTSEVRDKQWEKRPDYEDHLGDPTQLFYDRGHGVHDPFDEENPDKS
jgi:Uncharacterized protein conserved in bacteria (DUF2171)